MPWVDTSDAELKHLPALALSFGGYIGTAGFTFVMSLVSVELMDSLGLTVGGLASLTATAGIIKMSAQSVAGLILPFFGPKPAICLGVLAVSICCLGIARAQDVAHFTISYFVVCFFSPLADQPAHVWLLSSFFRRRLPFAIATVNAGYSAAGTTLPLLLTPLLLATSWRVVWGAWAGFNLFVLFVFLVLMKQGPIPLSSSSSSSKDAKALDAFASNDMTMKDVLRSWKLYCILVAGVGILVWEGVITAQYIILLRKDAGVSATVAATIYSSQYMCAIIGKMSCGLVIDALPRPLVFLPAPLIFCLSHLILIEVSAGMPFADALSVTHSIPRLFTFSIVYGLSFGFSHSLLTCQPASLFGRTTLPFVQNIYWTVLTLGYISGVKAIGMQVDAVGSFGLPLMLVTFPASAVFALCMAALMLAKPIPIDELSA